MLFDKHKNGFVSRFINNTVVKKKRSSGNHLTLPLYHHWNGETAGAIPSYDVGPSDGRNRAKVYATGIGAWNRSVPQDDNGDTVRLVIDLAAGDDTTDGIDPSIDDIRVVTLAEMPGTSFAYFRMWLTDRIDDAWQGNRVYFGLNENENPNNNLHNFTIDGVVDFNEEWAEGTGITGDAWRYYQWQWNKGGESWYNARWVNGDQMSGYPVSRAYQGTANALPNGLRYFMLEAWTWGHVKTAQIWIGTGEWPTFPMSPMSNL